MAKAEVTTITPAILKPKEVESEIGFGRDTIGGIPVFQVPQQEKDILQWNDKELMLEYVRLWDELLNATTSPFAP